MKTTFFSAVLAGALLVPIASTALAAQQVIVRPYYGYGWGGYNPYWYGWGAYPYGYGAYGYVVPGIRLQVKPKTAQVFVDGYYAGVVSKFDGFFQQLDLMPGGHNIEIRAPGFEPLTFTTYTQPDHTTDFKARMVPASGKTEQIPAPGTSTTTTAR